MVTSQSVRFVPPFALLQLLTFEKMIKVGLLLLAAAFNTHAENVTSFETEEIKSLNEVKNLQILGDLIVILEKNETETTPEGDAFEEYIRNHLIRIKSPLQENKYLDFELSHLIPEDEAEGRQKKRKGPIRDVLVPLLLMIKHKLSVALPLFLAMVTFVAFKGFWAGMSALVISKVIGLKLLLDSQYKQEGKEETNDQDNEEGQEEDEKPVVVFLNHHDHHDHHRRTSNRRHRPAGKRYYNPEGWDPWGRQRDFEKDGNRLNWGPWI